MAHEKGWDPSPETFPVIDCIPAWIEWQSKKRPECASTPLVLAGINYSIILASACYIEGFCELALLKRISPKPVAQLDGRLVDELRDRVSATTGSERYDRMFELVVGKRANAILAKPVVWEAVKHLFHFRNMIAHGRAVGYRLYFPPGVGGVWDEEFEGGYKAVEVHLMKKGLLDDEHIRVANNWHYFTNDIADYFWSVATDFVNTMNTNLPPLQKP